VNDIPLTAAWVAEVTRPGGARLIEGAREREFSGVSIDTRTIAPGELFIGIRGDRFDGAEFAQAAIDRGAAGVVVPEGWSAKASSARPAQADRPVVIEVADTIVALQQLGREIRRVSGTRVVAITGSAGKTTTKELTAELLETKFRVMRNRGNFNNHIGLPLSLIELRRRPEVAVVELGMNHAGEIRTLVGIAEPDIRVWTNVGEAHLGFFASVDAIADAKAEIFEGASTETVLVANGDDDRIVARLPRFKGRVVTFGIDRHADVEAVDVQDRGIEGTRARLKSRPGSTTVTVPLVGRGNLLNALAAAAVALEFGVPIDAIADRLSRVRPAPHRGEIARLANGVTVIDDSYNANPTATKGAIEVLAGSEGVRRIAVLGEMLELGDRSAVLHEEVGRVVAAAGIDLFFTVGGESAAVMARAAVGAGMTTEQVRHFATSDDAAAALVPALSNGDVVLVKGSRGIRTDRVVDRLTAERG
jgi:UDP-N-acetylmuramoyl-tripeptide--D-alanyl-D-alanine ligase